MLRSGNAARRVLFVITTTDFGGTESVLRELVRGLPGYALEPVLCSLCPIGRVGREIDALGAKTITLAMSAGSSFAESMKGVRALARLIDEERIDLVQTLLYRANMLGTLAARLSHRRPPVVSSQRSLTPNGAGMSARLVSWTRPLAIATVAVSEAVKREVLNKERTSEDSIVIIPNGVDLERFRPVDGAAARASLGIPHDAFAIGAVGRLTKVKGVEHLLEAVRIAGDALGGAHLLIVGDGPEHGHLVAQAAAANLSDRVHFAGATRDVLGMYAAMNLLALPSLQEGSPNVVLEAMACGLPVVASAVGGVPELVEDGRTGFLVRPGDAEALARSLVRAGSDRALAAELGRAGRRRIEEHFDIRLTVRRHAELYRTLLNGACPASAAGVEGPSLRNGA